MQNVTPIDEAILLHDDLYKGSLRLNVNAHGRVGAITTAAGNVGPEDLAVMMSRSNVNLSRYSNIRMIVCHSGEGGNASFAAQFAKITGKPVKGYIGRVSTNWEVDMFSSTFKGRPIDIIRQEFARSAPSRVIKVGVPYNPVKFWP